MPNLIQSVEHAFAVAATDIVKAAKFVETRILPALKAVAADEKIVEAVTGIVNPQAVNIERMAFAALGAIIKALDDAQAVGGAGGTGISLDAALIADIRAIAPAVRAQAALAQAGVK